MWHVYAIDVDFYKPEFLVLLEPISSFHIKFSREFLCEKENIKH